MKQIAVFLAEGFEEIEGLYGYGLLRRAGVTVTNVSVTGEKTVHGSHGIGVEADALFEEMEFEGMDMLVLPGGMPGTKHLKEHRDLCVLLKEFYAKSVIWQQSVQRLLYLENWDFWKAEKHAVIRAWSQDFLTQRQMKSR